MVKMIAVWGSGGSGKKLLSLGLATKLAAHKKNVVVINTDASTPALPVFLPTQQISAEGSIGRLLSSSFQSYNALKGYIHIHPQSNHIGFMGMTSGETPITYKSFARDKMMTLLKVLNDSPFDYIVFACMSNPVYAPLTQLALQTAEYPVRMITPDVRGMEFEKSQTGWMRNAENFRIEEQIRVINPVHTFSPLDNVITVSGPADYVLPFSGEVYGKSIAGQLIEGLKDKHGIIFENGIKELAERILSDEKRES